MAKAWLLLLAAMAACANDSPRHASAREGAAADVRTLTASREFAGERSVTADIEFAAGRLEVRPGPAGTLYHAVLRYDQRLFQPDVSYAAGVLHLGISGDGVKVNRHADENRLQLQLGPDAPLDLNLKFAAGESDVDLGGLRIRRAQLATGAARARLDFDRPTLGPCDDLELQVGAARMDVLRLGNLSPAVLDVQGGVGDVNLDFSGAARNDISARIHMGMGALRLDVPRDLGLRLQKSSMLASFNAPDMVRQGDVWLSPGYQNARHHLNVQIDAAFGAIRVNWLEAGGAGAGESASPPGDSSSF